MLFQLDIKPVNKVHEANYSYRKSTGVPEFLYRYEAHLASVEDGTSDQAYLITFNIIRQTPNSGLINLFQRMFVNDMPTPMLRMR